MLISRTLTQTLVLALLSIFATAAVAQEGPAELAPEAVAAPDAAGSITMSPELYARYMLLEQRERSRVRRSSVGLGLEFAAAQNLALSALANDAYQDGAAWSIVVTSSVLSAVGARALYGDASRGQIAAAHNGHYLGLMLAFQGINTYEAIDCRDYVYYDGQTTCGVQSTGAGATISLLSLGGATLGYVLAQAEPSLETSMRYRHAMIWAHAAGLLFTVPNFTGENADVSNWTLSWTWTAAGLGLGYLLDQTDKFSYGELQGMTDLGLLGVYAGLMFPVAYGTDTEGMGWTMSGLIGGGLGMWLGHTLMRDRDHGFLQRRDAFSVSPTMIDAGGGRQVSGLQIGGRF